MTGVELRSFVGHTGRVYSATFSPSGRNLITASEDRTAKLWDIQTRTCLLTLVGHTGPVRSAFSPDGQCIVTASDDGTARTWRMPDALLEVALRKVQRNPPVFTAAEKAWYGIED